MACERSAPHVPSQGKLSAEWILFTLSCLLYTAALAFQVADFPSYFLCDEAFHSATGQEIIKRGFRSSHDTLLPVYFPADGGRWTPAFSVYPQAFAAWLFGQSVATTRLTNVFISLLGVVGFSLFLRNSLKLIIWWLFPLLLAGFPAWFLHARTGFESPMMVSFIACGLGCYSFYTSRGSRWGLVAATVLWGCAFYTYSNGQLVLPVFIGILLLSDISVHRRNIQTVLMSLAVALLLMLPLVMFLYEEGFKQSEHLSTVGSPLFSETTIRGALAKVALEYLSAFSPDYWLNRTRTTDLARHYVGNLPHQVPWLGWAAYAGALLVFFRLKQSGARALFALLVAAPVAGALAQISITRVLGMTFPMVALAMLPADWVLRKCKSRWLSACFTTALFLGALTGTGFVLRYALVEAPTQISDYGLYGHQWGARQIFGEVIPRLLRTNPDSTINLYSTWSNAPERFFPFFLDEAARKRVAIKQIDTRLYAPITTSEIFIIPEPSLNELLKSGKMKTPEVLETITYPNGEPGFHVVRLSYVDNVDELYEIERQALLRVTSASVKVLLPGATQPVQTSIMHSPLDMGEPQNLFDGNMKTLARGALANPFFLSIELGSPGRTVKGMALSVGINAPEVTLRCKRSSSPTSTDVVTKGAFKQPLRERFTIPFSEPVEHCTRIELEVRDPEVPLDHANLHLNELEVL